MEQFNLWENTPGLAEEIPTLTYYPSENKMSDIAVVIFAGGGYGFRSRHEDHGYAEYLNSIGIDAFVCAYRVYPHHFPHELLDARRAVRTVRYYADKFGINKSKVLVMGSSAGGSLASLVSTYTKPIDHEGVDDIDKEDFIPNGQILCYPVITLTDERYTHMGSVENLVGKDNLALATEITPENNVSESTCPAFIWHTAEDTCVNVINSYLYATKLREKNVPVEMHIFPFGRHGMGLAGENPHVAQWNELLKNWLYYVYK